MNRAILIGGAVSGLILACAAYAANTSYQLTVQGTIAGFCNITEAPTDGPNGQPTSHDTTGSAFNFASSGTNAFGDSTGHGLHVWGKATLRVTSNTTCHYSATSANGTLLTSGGAARSYTANLYNDDVGTHPDPTTLDTHSAGKQIGVPFPLTSAVSHVKLEFDVPETTPVVLPAGDYSDTLTVHISPN